MTDIVYLYPKTSCLCGSCESKYTAPKGAETNLSVRGGKISPFFNCYDAVEINNSIQPSNKSGWHDLNPQAYTSKISPGFDRVACQTASSCPTSSYISMDPRLYSTTRMDYLPLDRPPMNGDVRLRDVYNDEYTNYGAGFQPYNKIRDGDITYYIDKSIEDAFYHPVYTEPAKQTTILYKDPMGAMKPQHVRTPLVNIDNPAVTNAETYPNCLSFLQDTQSFREDLISRQQTKHNQQKWSARWN
jgi:hypothetical protein